MIALMSLPDSVVGHLLAHQGGWDELLMVAVPVGIFAGLLHVANRRATRLAERREDEGPRDPAPVQRPPQEPRNERGGPI